MAVFMFKLIPYIEKPAYKQLALAQQAWQPCMSLPPLSALNLNAQADVDG